MQSYYCLLLDCFVYSSILKTEAACSSKTSVSAHNSTRRHNPEGHNPNSEVCLPTKQPGSCRGKSDLKAEVRFAVAFSKKHRHLTRSCITYAVDNASLNKQGRTNTRFASQGTPRLLRSPTTHDRVHQKFEASWKTSQHGGVLRLLDQSS
jgi:hypothetical protein